MKLTKHEEYGLRCLLRVAEEGPKRSLTIPEISKTEGISEAYAGKLLRMLRQGGLVKATRGKIGGYTLARPASEVSVGSVLRALDSPLFEGGFCDTHAGSEDTCVRSIDCSVRGLWRSVQTAVDQVLQQTTRPYDTCIRYGGDEFVVLLSSSGSAEAEEQRRRVQEAVATISLRTDDGREIPLRVSAGASVFPEDGDTYERLLARADRRMYRNKAESKTTMSIPAGVRAKTEVARGVAGAFSH